MPVFFFTFHAYLSWLPDRGQGYVRRGKGILPPDAELAGRYRRDARESAVTFDAVIQRVLIEELLVAERFQKFRLETAGTDPSHLHVLVSWRDDRGWDQLRNSIRSSLTRRLNMEFGRREWFVEGASRKHVKTKEHFDHLVTTYVPDHPGWKWSPQQGFYK